MRVFAIFIGFLLIGCKGNPDVAVSLVEQVGQEIDSAYVARHTTYFGIENDSIVGEGKKEILDIFNSSQFVVFGERHNSKPTSALTKALIPIMHKAGYNDICLEVGPHSAEKLKALSSDYENTVQNLKQFNSQYLFVPEGEAPIPFFTGIEDAQFLAAVSKHKMDCWGIDQEYYYAYLFLSDELLNSAKGRTNYSTIAAAKQKADAVFLKWLTAEVHAEEEIDVFSEILADKQVIEYFNFFPDAQILKDLKISWDIYSRWRQGSHADRISYMRNNFLAKLAAKSKATPTPKVFIKVGQVHAAKTISKGAYDIGHLTEELASRQGTISTSINCWTRFEKKGGEIVDHKDDWYQQMNLFIAFGRQDQWAVINYRAIRADVEKGKRSLPSDGDYHKIRRYLDQYDYQFILPMNESVTENVTE